MHNDVEHLFICILFFVCLRWRNYPWSIFSWAILSFFIIMCVLSFSRYRSLTRYMILKKFSPILSLSFHLMMSFKSTKSFSFDDVHFIIFPFVTVLLVPHLKTHCLMQNHKTSIFLSSLIFYLRKFKAVPIKKKFFCFYSFNMRKFLKGKKHS